jgi:hypothetical protein
MLKQSVIAAVLVIALAPGARAQQPAAAPRSAATATESAIDVSRLPIDVSRIHRELRQTTESEQRNGINLRYVIDVYGNAPPINILDPKRDNLVNGPVPYGGPTHQQMLQIMTPQEFRAPTADFGALIRWLSDKAKDK